VDIEGPVAALGEFAVADDVDSGCDLLAHHLVDGVLQAGLVGGHVIGLAGLDLAQDIDKFRRPDQAADMGDENAAGMRGHWSS